MVCVFGVCVYYVYLYMGQVPKIKLILANKLRYTRASMKAAGVNVWYTVWVKKIPPTGPDIFHFFHKWLRIFNPFLPRDAL